MTPGHVRSLDEYDDAVYREAFVLADAVRRFLARRQTEKVIAAGLLDDDVIRALAESSGRMQQARLARVGQARSEATS